ncbi:MAG: hypothetical protein Q8P13_00040 [bacterium]|nr:hypothetical protein [bacterium]
MGKKIEEMDDVLKGGEKNMIKKTISTTEIVSDEELEKQADKADVSDKAAYMDCVKQNMKDGMDMSEAGKKCKMAQNKGKADDADPVEEPKKEEVVEEAEAAPEGEAKAEEASEEVAEGDKVSDLVKQVMEKLDAIEASLKKGDSASAEGAASEEAVPEGGAEKAPVEEEAPATSNVVEEDASPEGAEEIAKASEVLVKISDKLEKFEKSLNERLDKLDGRVNKLEEQPAPSKVVSGQVVSKVKADNSSPRLEEIEKELNELEEMKKSYLDRYQKEKKWEKAFELIAEKNSLLQA